jgi:CrcB protein
VVSAGTLVALGGAGALGAVGRAVLDELVTRRASPPWGTAVVNLLGSLLAGVAAGLVVRGSLDGPLATIVLVGFLGSFTTFSTWMVETVSLASERRHAAAIGSVATLLAGAGAAWLGVLVGGA